MSIIVRDCDWIVTQNDSRDVLRDSSVLLEDGRIVQIGKDVKARADHVIDGRGKILIPGLINTHTHASMTLFRGYADDMYLQEWLTTKIWPLESRLTGEACYYGALLGCLEMIRTGTTCFADMYFFMEDVARAVSQSGLRGFLCYGIIDLFDPARAERERKAAERFVQFVKGLSDPKVKFMIGPHAPYTCSEETLLWAKDKAVEEDAILHIHIAETRREQAEFYKKHGMRVVEYLDKIGFLCPNVLAAHCVWLTKSEVKILSNAGAKVAHCPVSNMKLATGGMAPLPEMFELGVTVGLGTDGPASNNTLDMFEAMKFCALAHKAYRWEPTLLPAQRVLDLATIEGAKALNAGYELGSIEVGKAADLVLIDARSPNLIPIHGVETVVSDLVYSARGFNVDTTIVGGRILMEGKRFTSLNEAEIYEKAQSIASDLVSRVF